MFTKRIQIMVDDELYNKLDKHRGSLSISTFARERLRTSMKRLEE